MTSREPVGASSATVVIGIVAVMNMLIAVMGMVTLINVVTVDMASTVEPDRKLTRLPIVFYSYTVVPCA